MQAKDIFIKKPISEPPEERGEYIITRGTDSEDWINYYWDDDVWRLYEGGGSVNPEAQGFTHWLLPMEKQYILSYEEMNEFVRHMRIRINHEANGIAKYKYPKFDHYLKAFPQPYNQTPEEDREVRGF